MRVIWEEYEIDRGLHVYNQTSDFECVVVGNPVLVGQEENERSLYLVGLDMCILGLPKTKKEIAEILTEHQLIPGGLLPGNRYRPRMIKENK